MPAGLLVWIQVLLGVFTNVLTIWPIEPGHIGSSVSIKFTCMQYFFDTIPNLVNDADWLRSHSGCPKGFCLIRCIYALKFESYKLNLSMVVSCCSLKDCTHEATHSFVMPHMCLGTFQAVEQYQRRLFAITAPFDPTQQISIWIWMLSQRSFNQAISLQSELDYLSERMDTSIVVQALSAQRMKDQRLVLTDAPLWILIWQDTWHTCILPPQHSGCAMFRAPQCRQSQVLDGL